MNRDASTLPLFPDDPPAAAVRAAAPDAPRSAPAAAEVAPLEETRRERAPLLRSLPTQVASVVWLGDEIGGAPPPTTSTGFPALDAELPGGGWPMSGVTEVLLPQAGLAEWRLLLPGLAAAATPAKPLLLISPPHVPFLSGLRRYGLVDGALVIAKPSKPADRLWAAEQAAKSDGLAGVIAWLPQARSEQIRRLQSASVQAGFPLLLVRPETALHESSPAPLRLQVRVQGIESVEVHVLKRRGTQHEGWITLAALPPGFERLRLRENAPPRDPRHAVGTVLDRPVGPRPRTVQRSAA